MLASKPTKGYPGWAHRADLMRGVKVPSSFSNQTVDPSCLKKRSSQRMTKPEMNENTR